MLAEFHDSCLAPGMLVPLSLFFSPCYTANKDMIDDKNRWRTRWLELAHNWGDRAAEAGLGGVVGAIGEAVRPLAPVASQLLWFAQPAFGVFGQADAVGALAELCEQPDVFRQASGESDPHESR